MRNEILFSKGRQGVPLKWVPDGEHIRGPIP